MVSVESRRGLVRAGKGHCRLMPKGVVRWSYRVLSPSPCPSSFIFSSATFHSPSFILLFLSPLSPSFPLTTFIPSHSWWQYRVASEITGRVIPTSTTYFSVQLTPSGFFVRPVYSPLGRDTFALHESPGVHGRKSRLSSGKSYAHAGHQGNENGSYYVTEQREALDVIENSIPFNTRFIRPLSDGRGQGLPLLKLSASEKNVTSKLRYIRSTRELRFSRVLRFTSKGLPMHFHVLHVRTLCYRISQWPPWKYSTLCLARPGNSYYRLRIFPRVTADSSDRF